MEGTIGEIRGFGGTFAPRTWAFCDGQILAISQNTALFSIIGCTFGGDCRTTFGLPDLRGRAPLQQGTGPGLTHIGYGERGGTNIANISYSQMPAHTHAASATIRSWNGDGDKRPSGGNFIAGDAGSSMFSETADNNLATDAMPVNIGNTGGGQPFSIQNPYLGINMIICLTGTYPSRS